jgi:hypothetical protein
MPMKLSLSQPRLATQMIAATFAGVIAVGMLASVTELFVRDGWPMERLAVGERAYVAAARMVRSLRPPCPSIPGSPAHRPA